MIAAGGGERSSWSSGLLRNPGEEREHPELCSGTSLRFARGGDSSAVQDQAAGT